MMPPNHFCYGLLISRREEGRFMSSLNASIAINPQRLLANHQPDIKTIQLVTEIELMPAILTHHLLLGSSPLSKFPNRIETPHGTEPGLQIASFIHADFDTSDISRAIPNQLIDLFNFTPTSSSSSPSPPFLPLLDQFTPNSLQSIPIPNHF